MCQQLKAAGEDVALLVFLDTPIARRPDLSRKDKAIIHWQGIRRRGIGYIVDWVKRRIRWERDKRHKQQEAAARPFEFRSAEIAKAFYDALAHYDTQPFDGRVVLFRPELDESHVLGPGRVVSHAREFVYHDNDWGRFVPGGVEVIEVPGDHDGMVLEPSVRVLAANLRRCIEEAERGVRVRPVELVPVG
jgi:thioesterase domain-containing protein